ncbi:hypothetical protein [Thermotoga sp.]|uniref:hypothetical protein n=1 Tax=Thermotoga sp. TaxID=28240 RepID=UPI0025E7BC4F|nr:hypothetical protein [Thermotoga sp.]MCD6551521.1 hypothetical protein [Thermotoga sp.]
MKSRLRKLERRLLGRKRRIAYIILTNRRDKKTKKTYWEVSLGNDEEKTSIDSILREFWEESKKGTSISEEVVWFRKKLQKEIRVFLLKMTEPQDHTSSYIFMDEHWL